MANTVKIIKSSEAADIKSGFIARLFSGVNIVIMAVEQIQDNVYEWNVYFSPQTNCKNFLHVFKKLYLAPIDDKLPNNHNPVHLIESSYDELLKTLMSNGITVLDDIRVTPTKEDERDVALAQYLISTSHERNLKPGQKPPTTNVEYVEIPEDW